MYFERPSEWREMVAASKHAKDYSNIINEMFIDKKFTNSRWHVLEIYTQDVCGRVDSATAQDVFQYYTRFKEEHSSGWTISKLFQW